MLYYARRHLDTLCPAVSPTNPITRNVYKHDRSLANPLVANKTPTFVPPSTEELSTVTRAHLIRTSTAHCLAHLPCLMPHGHLPSLKPR